MFRDTDAWPPAPDGWQPPPPPRAPGRERAIMAAVALLLIAFTFGPFAGSSLVAMVIALVHAAGDMFGR